MPFTPDEGITWSVNEIPFVAGVDLRTPSRLVRPPNVSVAENVSFDTLRAGFRGRRGHDVRLVRTAARLDLDQARGSYLFGAGVAGETLEDIEAVPGPDAGFLRGMARRDQEVLAWDGWRMFSYPAGQDYGGRWQTPASAVMPHSETSPIAKSVAAQEVCDAGLTDKLLVVATIEGDDCLVRVYDATTRAFLREVTLEDRVSCRVVPCGEWVHVLAARTGASENLRMMSFHPATVHNAEDVDGLECDQHYDVKKVDETHWLVAARKNDGTVTIAAYSPNATVLYSFEADTVVDAIRVAVAQHPLTGEILLFWQGGDGPNVVNTYFYDRQGLLLAFPGGTDATIDNIRSLACEARYTTNTGTGLFEAFVAYTDGSSNAVVKSDTVWQADGFDGTYRRYHAALASHPWRVGDAVFVTLVSIPFPAVGQPLLQLSYFPCDTALLPVGRLEYGTANLPAYLFGVYSDPGQDGRNNARHHGALTYNVRVGTFDEGIYTEASVKLVRHDFLPKLRSAALGRAVYFPGSQTHAWDGRNLVEAGFHLYPERVTAADSGSAGSPNGTYTYRVRWAWKNAQGEEVVSAAVYTSPVTVATNKITVNIPTFGFTRKTGVYALVYRNEGTPGTTWYLVSDRDPTATGDNGAVANDPDSTFVAFTDDLSDADLIEREQDVIGNGGELEPFSPPASTIIGVGRDRLWLAGGELPPGDVLPSKRFVQGRGPQFTQFLQTTVDRGFEPVTGFAFMGNSSLVFKESRVYAFEADGPNNLGAGEFDQPRVIVTDTGAVSPDAIFLSTDGVWYQAPSGLKLLGTNYYLQDAGEPVYPEAAGADFRGVVSIDRDQEIRFYRADGPALVYNTATRGWTTWPGLECAGAVALNDAAVLGRLDGRLYVESDTNHTDGGRGFVTRVQTASLSPDGLQGFFRLRRYALLGEFNTARKVRIRVYYNDREYAEEDHTWDPTDASDQGLNTDTWGAGSWGDGRWGDTTVTAVPGTSVRDAVYAFRRRPRRQKCSRFRVELTDDGGPGLPPAYSALAFEVGRRGGLTRLPHAVGGSEPAGGGGNFQASE